MKIIRPHEVLVQSEYEETRFYKVNLGNSAREDRCNCFGVRQYLGRKKNGEIIYRDKNNCFHVEWARKYAKEGREVLTCQ